MALLSSRYNHLLLKLLLLLLCLAVMYGLLYPGVYGRGYYDDYHNLSPLNSVHDFRTALVFIFSGEAGPIGRPLSLASFIIHAGGWVENIGEILHLNLLIHMLNVILVFIFSNLIGSRLGFYGKRKYYFSIAVSVIWGLSPINFPAIFIPIQRMAVLSGFFVFLGLIVYIYLLTRFESSKKGIFVSLSALMVFSLLATLSKESGALLIPLALLIDYFWFKDSKCSYHATDKGVRYSVRFMRRSVLWVLVLFIYVYMAYLGGNWFEVAGIRGYSPLDRLTTQSVILFEYVFYTFIPDVFYYHPFHDGYDVVLYNDFKFIVSLFSWLALFCGAYVVRKKVPIIMFSIVFYFLAHSSESTFLMLELYFEHRNYIASLGIVILFVWFVFLINNLSKLSLVFLPVYILIIAFSSNQLAILWSDHETSAQIWFDLNPASARAANNYAIVLQENGASVGSLIGIFDEASFRCESCIITRMESLSLSCYVNEGEDRGRIKVRLEEVVDKIPSALPSSALLKLPMNLLDSYSAGECSAIGLDDVEKLMSALMKNEELMKVSGYASSVHHMLYRFSKLNGDLFAAEKHIMKAFEISKKFPIYSEIMNYYYKSGNDTKVAEMISLMENSRPFNPAKRIAWDIQFNQINGLYENGE
ncbi:hypothetical protein [Nitrincola sp. MINF-07-Sa-05]|uniref:hypothetical protein n=1 Tax=Nitrincola salilacus TaxID=3400273 RepID=UPI00391816EC